MAAPKSKFKGQRKDHNVTQGLKPIQQRERACRVRITLGCPRLHHQMENNTSRKANQFFGFFRTRPAPSVFTPSGTNVSTLGFFRTNPSPSIAAPCALWSETAASVAFLFFLVPTRVTDVPLAAGAVALGISLRPITVLLQSSICPKTATSSFHRRVLLVAAAWVEKFCCRSTSCALL
jgi:hypothetical protein